MPTPQNFLVTYGLHTFVSYGRDKSPHAFFIKGQEGPKMIAHATGLIKGMFGEGAEIETV